MLHCCKQRGQSSDVGCDDVRRTEIRLNDEACQERAHRSREQQIRPPSGSTEAREVDSEETRLFG